MSATGEIDLGDLEVRVLDTREHDLNEDHVVSIRIAERRKRFNQRKKLTRRARPHARERRARALAERGIGHLESVYLDEVLNFDQDDGSDEFLTRELSSAASDADLKRIRLPPYFDSRIMWGERCWYPLRDQGKCGSCYAVSIVDAISNRACISTVYGDTDLSKIEDGQMIEHMRAVPRAGAHKPPPLAVQPVISCMRLAQDHRLSGTVIARGGDGKADHCVGGVLRLTAQFISKVGLIGEPNGKSDSSAKGLMSVCTNADDGNKCPGSYNCMPLTDRQTPGDENPKKCPWNKGEQVSCSSLDCMGKVFRPEDDAALVVKAIGFQTSGKSLKGVSQIDSVQLLPHQRNVSAISADLIRNFVGIIKAEIMMRGPVAATIKFDLCAYNAMKVKESGKAHSDLDLYPLGSLDASKKGACASPHEFHSVKVIGWATIGSRRTSSNKVTPVDVWIIQNSWGSDGAQCLLNNPSSDFVLYDAPAPSSGNRGDGPSPIPAEQRKQQIRYPTTPHVSDTGYFFFPMYKQEDIVGERSTVRAKKPTGPNVEFRTIAPIISKDDVASPCERLRDQTPSSEQRPRPEKSSAAKELVDGELASSDGEQTLSPKVLVIIGSLIGFVILVAVIFWWRWRSRSRASSGGRKSSGNQAATQSPTHSGSRTG